MLPQYKIGLLGQKGSGKSFIARNIKGVHYIDKRNAEILSFAKPIKDMTVAFLDTFLPKGKAQLYAHDPAYKETKVTGLDVTARHIMQTLGTEWGRELIGKDVWRNILLMYSEGAYYDDEATVICDDVRFTDEADALKDHDWILTRVVSKDEKTGDTHTSEKPAECLLDLIIVNEKDGDLLNKVEYELLIAEAEKVRYTDKTVIYHKGNITFVPKVFNHEVTYNNIPKIIERSRDV